MLDYDVAFSGSSGNAVRIKDILFDIGIPAKDNKMNELLNECNYVFISHKHCDHLNLSTYKTLCEFYPLIKVYVNQQTYDFIIERTPKLDHSNLIVFHDKEKILLDDGIEIDIYQTKHEKDLFSTAYLGITDDFETFMFATDFYDFNDLPDGPIDYFFVEANHDENYAWYLKQIEELGGPRLKPWIIRSTGRHTTKQNALKYYETNRSSKESEFIPLHKSSRFYDMQDYKEQIKDLLNRGEDNETKSKDR